MIGDIKSAGSATGRRSVLNFLLSVFRIPLLAVLLIIFALLSWMQPYDDSDDEANGKRSNMSLRVDYGTGCQYLGTGLFGGLTPRLDKDGRHVGCR